MSITVQCSGCGSRFRADDKLAGRRGKCPKCSAAIEVPLFDRRETSKTGIQPTITPDSSSATDEQIQERGRAQKSALQVVVGDGTAFPLTIVGVSKDIVTELLSVIDGLHPTHSSVAELVALTGLRCKEIDEFVEKCRPRYAEAIARYKEEKSAFDEQGANGDMDEPEAPDPVAACGLEAYPYLDITPLFEGESFSAEFGRELVLKYGFENLQSWCNQWSRGPRPVPEGHAHRRRCDDLVRVGLATWGPPMKKRGKSGPAFTIVRPPELPDATELRGWIRRCETEGELIHHTYLMARSCGARNEIDPDMLEILNALKVTPVDDDRTCPYCHRMGGKKYLPNQGPRPPFHLGCRCSMLEIFK